VIAVVESVTDGQRWRRVVRYSGAWATSRSGYGIARRRAALRILQRFAALDVGAGAQGLAAAQDLEQRLALQLVLCSRGWKCSTAAATAAIMARTAATVSAIAGI
jgi:hypothetical protein